MGKTGNYKVGNLKSISVEDASDGSVYATLLDADSSCGVKLMVDDEIIRVWEVDQALALSEFFMKVADTMSKMERKRK